MKVDGVGRGSVILNTLLSVCLWALVHVSIQVIYHHSRSTPQRDGYYRCFLISKNTRLLTSMTPTRLWAFLRRHRENFYFWHRLLMLQPTLLQALRAGATITPRELNGPAPVISGAVRERLKIPVTGTGGVPPAPAPRDHPWHLKLGVRLPGRAGPCRHTNKRPVPRRASPGPRRAPAPAPAQPAGNGGRASPAPAQEAAAARAARRPRLPREGEPKAEAGKAERPREPRGGSRVAAAAAASRTRAGGAA